METYRDTQGFTLVELMITVAISGLVIAAVYSAYTVQQRSHTAQSQVTEMQQNIRAALNMMTVEIRMAGFDPTGTAGAGITAVGTGRIRFTQDITEDGDTTDANEDIIYGFSLADDADNDGIADAGAASLGRNTGAGFQPIADNIQAVEFIYLDSNGNPTAVLNAIRSVQISILARAGRPDPEYTNTVTYIPASGIALGTPWDLNGAAAGNANPPNDNFRRRLMIATVKCRNLGL